MLEKKCDCCGKMFEYSLSRRPNARFCSRSCLSKQTKKEQDEKRSLDWSNETEQESLNAMKAKFDKFVIKSEGCWDWSGTKNKQGYGGMLHRHKVLKAHRVSYMIHKGMIPDGLFILHRCDNTSCSNPEHLFLGNQSENMIDMVSKNRNHVRNKINSDQVLEIRKMLSLDIPMTKIAKKYNVSDVCIFYIKHNKSWKDII